jgi:molybdenum cofactor biosynthesis enzyme MoaA
MFWKNIAGKLDLIVAELPNGDYHIQRTFTAQGKYWVTLPAAEQTAEADFDAQLSELENSRAQEARQELAKFNNIWSIVLLVTDKCNANCEICLRFRDASPELQFAEMQKIIEILRRFDVKRISFTGGEPLLNPNLPKLIKYAYQQGLSTSLSTNGTLLNQKFIAAVSGSLNEIIIPVDGSTAEIFGSIVPYGSTEHLTHLKNLFKYILENSSIRLKPITVASKSNLTDLPNIAGILSVLGVQFWKIDEFYEVADNANEASNHNLKRGEFDSALSALRAQYPELTIVGQGVEQREKNNVFFISPSGQVIQNKEHQNRAIGTIFNKPADFLSSPNFYSNTATANYTVSSLSQTESRNEIYWQEFQRIHQGLLESMSATGASKIFRPHTDYGANILIPHYLRSRIYQDFAQYNYPEFRDDYYEINPDLYSIGISPLGRHLTDTRFYFMENIWKNISQTKLAITGPFWGEGCIFYLARPQNQNYFADLKTLFQNKLGQTPRPTINDTAVGWINVARTRRNIPQNVIVDWQQNSLPNNLGDFQPTKLGAVKSDWHENIYDAETTVIE